jgi:hypothetical protein
MLLLIHNPISSCRIEGPTIFPVTFCINYTHKLPPIMFEESNPSEWVRHDNLLKKLDTIVN